MQNNTPKSTRLQRHFLRSQRSHSPLARLLLATGLLLVAAALAGLTTLSARPAAETSVPDASSLPTTEHLSAELWWPTKPVSDKGRYAGTAACASCHAEIVASQGKSQMARTLGSASESPILQRSQPGAYSAGPYRYGVSHQGKSVVLAVSGGDSSASATLQLAIGSGDVGQSYIWRSNDDLLESRFNYFASLHGFAATPGRLHGAPTSLSMAVGRPIAGFEAKTCITCHTTQAPSEVPTDLTAFTEGVRCEGCHGPGAEHIAAAHEHALARQSSSPAGTAPWDHKIFNSASLAPAKAIDACGACHSTPWDARLMGAVGVQTVRFPAARLVKSRCWGISGDAKLTCSGCHDPHEPLAHDPVSYDTTCLSCHATKEQAHLLQTAQAASATQTSGTASLRGAACPVASTKCVSCHMPKYEVPEMHASFTDHNIRIARSAAFPQ